MGAWAIGAPGSPGGLHHVDRQEADGVDGDPVPLGPVAFVVAHEASPG